jgi:hypothetical protein
MDMDGSGALQYSEFIAASVAISEENLASEIEVRCPF